MCAPGLLPVSAKSECAVLGGHAPGPWVERFRATIPFEQLYQLLRKVIPPGEKVGERLTFLPTEAVYYNERIHRENYPTPWTINQL